MVIKDSIILITSAGSQIGRAISCHFSALGARLILIDCNNENLLATHQTCEHLGGHVSSYLLNDESDDNIRQIFSLIDDQYEMGIDVMINTLVEDPSPSLLSSNSVEIFSSQLTDLASRLFCVGKSAAQNMRNHNKQGVIINLVTNQIQNIEFDSLSNSRAVLTGITQSWAKELNKFKIRVGGITPTFHCIDQLPSTGSQVKLQSELVRNTEYIVQNDSFNGRMLEAECH
ncbi:MAG: SDR family oxidoreductase [Aliivibrio sp.]|uniref:SDR family oxidoreductase n=1 Tax=Aliivibrio sp. TaxID=1872443 RepID=UPI001A3E003E|nr:SDR family oxidoreductase [Aliivibrio sp.]